MTRVAAHRCCWGISCSRVNLPGCKSQIAGCCTNPFSPMLDKCLACVCVCVCVLFYTNDTQFFYTSPSGRCVKKKPSPVDVSKRNPVPSLCPKETQYRRCIKKKSSPVVVSKRNPVPSLCQKETQSRHSTGSLVFQRILI